MTSLRVLIVEDRSADAELMVAGLEAAGFHPHWTRVETEPEFVAALAARPDVILTDYRLPAFDALGALDLARRHDPTVPVIVVSGTIGEDLAVEAIRLGASDYVLKDRMGRLGHAVRAALDRAALARTVHEVEGRFRALLEHALDVVTVLDAEGVVRYASPSLERLLGWRPEERLGRPVLELVHPEDLARATAVFTEDHRPGHQVTLELRLRHRDGTWRAFEGIARSLVHDPAIAGVVVNLRDVTDRRRSEEALRQSEKLAAMSSLLAGVAHELNNPLGAVVAHTDLLRLRVSDPDLAGRLDRIARAAERAARVVKNFLAIARRHTPSREVVVLNQVVQQGVELLAYSLRTDGIDVALNLGGDLPPLWADGHQLHQVVVNLVSNAHHALRGAAPPRRLRLATRFLPAAGRVRLDIADTGPGIPPEILARLFEPFFTTKPPGVGTGLGLSISRGIAESHGGTLTCKSQVGFGTVFVVEMPVTPIPERPADPAEPRAAILGKRVLVIDDEPGITDLVVDILDLDGHAVDTAADGREALARLARGACDAILCDLHMPVLDGAMLHRTLEEQRPDLLARLAFITGDTLGPDAVAFLERVRVPVLNKPFTPAELRDLVQRILRAQGGDGP